MINLLGRDNLSEVTFVGMPNGWYDEKWLVYRPFEKSGYFFDSVFHVNKSNTVALGLYFRWFQPEIWRKKWEKGQGIQIYPLFQKIYRLVQISHWYTYTSATEPELGNLSTICPRGLFVQQPWPVSWLFIPSCRQVNPISPNEDNEYILT